MDGKTAAELRLEPCGLRRHDVAGIRDIHKLFHRNRVERECDLHLSAVDAARKFAESADTAHEIDPLRGAEVGDAENLVQDKIL